MNLQQCESFGREVRAILQQQEQLQEAVDQLNGLLRIAQTQANMEQVRKLVQQRTLTQEALDATSKVLCERTNRPSADAVREYVTDFFARLHLAHQQFERWRLAKAEFELHVSMPEEGFDRAAEERRLSGLKMRYERSVQLTAEYVPDKPVVLIP